MIVVVKLSMVDVVSSFLEFGEVDDGFELIFCVQNVVCFLRLGYRYMVLIFVINFEINDWNIDIL